MQNDKTQELLEEKLKQLNEMAKRIIEEGAGLNSPELIKLNREVDDLRMELIERTPQ